jgi:two-component system cell cycle sensor histidine kinase/response regulator CckA
VAPQTPNATVLAVPRWWRTTLLAAGGFLAALGLLVLAAWASGEIALVQVSARFAPLHYNAALALLAWGAGLAAMALGFRRAVLVLAIPLAAFGALLSAGHFGAVHGLDRWWFVPPPGAPAFPPAGVLPPVATAFFLAGLALALTALPVRFPHQPLLNALIGAILLTGSAAALIGFETGLRPGQSLGPPLLALLAVSLGGGAFVIHACRPGATTLPSGFGLPALVGLAGITVSVFLWQGLDAQQNRRSQRAVQFEAAHLQRLFDEGLSRRVNPLGDIAGRWGLMPESQRRGEVDQFVARQPGCLGVARVGPGGEVRWIEAGGRSDLPGEIAGLGVEDGFADSVRAGRATAGRALRSRWGGARVLVLFVPHALGAPGGLVAVVKAQQWLDTLCNANVAAGYALLVTDAEGEVYGRFAADDRFRKAFEQALPLEGPCGSHWWLHVWPTSEVLQQESLSLPKLALAVGFLTTTLLSLAVHLARTARRRTRDLEKEVRERVQAVAALKQSEGKYRALIENLEQGVFLKDRAGRFAAANGAFCRAAGRAEAELLGRTEAEVAPGPTAAARADEDRLVLAEGRKLESEQEAEVGGRRRVVRRILTPVRDEAGQVVGVLGICWDVTEQRALEARVRQAGKMDAIGQLAGGIAHDFNNLLTAILGNLELLLDGLPAGDGGREPALAAQAAAARATSLTGRLLGFSRQHQLHWAPTDLNDVAAEVAALLGRTIDPRVRIEVRKGPRLWPVHADPDQMNQVVMNLCLNARDAIAGAGRITVETANVDVGTETVSGCPADAACGPHVRLRVRDTGCGMTEEVKARIFEPFFTTKEVGKGTGLGLAMVFAIVKQHGGWVECLSQPGRGTTFDVYLPRSETSVTPVAAPTRVETAGRHGRETILIADDEPMIRRLASLVLQRSGYTVLEAEDGRRAVEVFARERDRIDLVLLDLTMPQLSGQEAFRQMRLIEPGVKVIFASGYAADVVAGEEQDLVLGFVKKPYRPDDLVSAVQEALAKAGAGAAPTACGA